MKTFYKHTDNGILINIKVVPNSAKTMIMGIEPAGLGNEFYLKIKISSPANENKANGELIKFISKELKLPKSSVIILKGEKNKEKKLLLKEYFNEENLKPLLSAL